MYTISGATNERAQRWLENMGYGHEDVLRMTCLAIAHGVYHNKRIVLINDMRSATWVIVVR